MHVVEELWALFSQEERTGPEGADTEAGSPDIVYSISIHALTGVAASTSGVIQLQAFIANHEVLILVDSGSSTSFINKQLALTLPGIQQLANPCKVKVADGSQQSCTSVLPNCQWWSHGHQF
jgi:predicted aspartyl protease